MDSNSRYRNSVDESRGRFAETPGEITFCGYRDVFWRVFSEFTEDRVTLVAAGATYYLLLALFPALAALVSLYGVFSDPVTIAKHIAFLSTALPPGAFDIIVTQLDALSQQKDSTLSFGVITGFVVALWSANNGIKALFEAMNIAYGEIEKRGIIWLNLNSLGFTLGALLIAIALITAVGVVPAILGYLWLDKWTEFLAKIARWPFLLIVVGCGITMMYRYGPSREPAKLRWITWGATFSTSLWLTASVLFSLYLENFADYNATYGTLGALIGLMVWTWISVIILILGAEINAELEHQTTVDSTTGKPLPMGDRGAHVADTMGAKSD
ncbi:YihY/virulence factor BrkB family protein [Agrobacterium rosae]|uniref:YihY/virulence factor BrkB family protein n=1 Tax=Agrobacterium rosae TaxID=1972867 RepID=A0ABU4W5H2_9HYPH|nr:YihY/virulence factor BrkB family protein [Agrobacterium rosae]MDX8333040.1 YihY/virulence factor BrkB family protein [Agrobacterium rosae]